MTPAPFHLQQYHNADVNKNISLDTDHNRDSTSNWCALKVNKESRTIKKRSPSISFSPSSSTTSNSSPCGGIASNPRQQRQPVIIYTHSPKVIHTNPKDFMSLVQKLTGLSRTGFRERADHNKNKKTEIHDHGHKRRRNHAMGDLDNDSSSVVTTDENCSSSIIGDISPVNSCIGSALSFDPVPNHFMGNMQLIFQNPPDLLCSSASDNAFFDYRSRFSI